MGAYSIEHYLAPGERQNLYLEWLRRLRDIRAKVAVIRRVARMELGNLGDHKPCREGVWELRVDVGPGYRVYYALSGHRIVLLLCGGDKRSQEADIGKAVAYWQDWQRRSDDEKQTK